MRASYHGREWLLLVISVAIMIGCSSNSTPSTKLPTHGFIDWSNIGVGEIPTRPTTCTTVDASNYGNGSTDATDGIQTALDACSSEQAVALSAGKFLIAGSLSVPDGVTLRGAGADQTILDAQGSGKGAVRLGTESAIKPAVEISNGATRGSTSITVSDASDIAQGRYLIISELNDSSYVSIHGGEGDCTWCDYSSQGNRARGQIVEVTSVDGIIVGITPALYSDYPNSPQAASFEATKRAGVEDLQVYANNTGYTSSFYLYGCAYCWLKGVEANYTDGDYVQVHRGFRDEIRDSYFSNAFKHEPGGTDSDVFLGTKTSASLVENNIIERGHVSIMLNWGAAGNIIAYNYAHGEFDKNATNSVRGSISMHGAHPQFNLIEGNVITKLSPDQIWGSSSHNTIFRNWVTGTTRVCLPTEGRATVDCSGTNGHWTFQSSIGMSIANQSTAFSFIGNIVGSEEQADLHAYGNTNTLPMVAILRYPEVRSYDGKVFNFTFGYGEASDDGTGDGCAGSTMPPCHSTRAYDTAFLHGNYTHADGAITWSESESRDLVPSMYLTGKPSWWGELPFPSIGPDVTGGSGPGGYSHGNPAKTCYETVMGGTVGGQGSPRAFNAKTCYGP